MVVQRERRGLAVAELDVQPLGDVAELLADGGDLDARAEGRHGLIQPAQALPDVAQNLAAGHDVRVELTQPIFDVLYVLRGDLHLGEQPADVGSAATEIGHYVALGVDQEGDHLFESSAQPLLLGVASQCSKLGQSFKTARWMA